MVNVKALGRFVEGERSSPKTEFTKGHIPWNKGKKDVQVSPRKGKKYPEKQAEYKRELNDWFWLCRSCHKKYDLSFNIGEKRFLHKIERKTTL